MLKVADPTNPPNQALIRDLVEWLAAGPRDYDDVMAAWRTSCPRLTIWEDACDLGLVKPFTDNGIAKVRITEKGAAYIAKT